MYLRHLWTLTPEVCALHISSKIQIANRDGMPKDQDTKSDGTVAGLSGMFYPPERWQALQC